MASLVAAEWVLGSAALYGSIGRGGQQRLRQARRSLADRLHPSHATLMVERLYGEITHLREAATLMRLDQK